MGAGVRRAGVQAWRVAVDRTVVVSSIRYPHWATAHHDTPRWFAERYKKSDDPINGSQQERRVAWQLLLLHSRARPLE